MKHACPEFVEIPAGTFRMGDIWGDGRPDEYPVRECSMPRFLLSRYTIANREYVAFLNDSTVGHTWVDAENPRSPFVRSGSGFVCREEYLDHPATFVSCAGAVAYCEWLARSLPALRPRLPREAEWQYAALGPERYKWGLGDVFEPERYVTGRDGPERVRTGEPTAWGLYNITGNVFEWCDDEYTFSLSPDREALTGHRVIKGGAFILNDSANFRSAQRFSCHEDSCLASIGFRIAATIGCHHVHDTL